MFPTSVNRWESTGLYLPTAQVHAHGTTETGSAERGNHHHARCARRRCPRRQGLRSSPSGSSPPRPGQGLRAQHGSPRSPPSVCSAASAAGLAAQSPRGLSTRPLLPVTVRNRRQQAALAHVAPRRCVSRLLPPRTPKAVLLSLSPADSLLREVHVDFQPHLPGHVLPPWARPTRLSG